MVVIPRLQAWLAWKWTPNLLAKDITATQGITAAVCILRNARMVSRYAMFGEPPEVSRCPSQVQGLYVEAFPVYGNASVPPKLPIDPALQPTRVTTAPNLNYSSAATGGVFDLAGATSYFGLRFTGEGGARAGSGSASGRVPAEPCLCRRSSG